MANSQEITIAIISLKEYLAGVFFIVFYACCRHVCQADATTYRGNCNELKYRLLIIEEVGRDVMRYSKGPIKMIGFYQKRQKRIRKSKIGPAHHDNDLSGFY